MPGLSLLIDRLARFARQNGRLHGKPSDSMTIEYLKMNDLQLKT
jgi:hypothetical protein